MLTRVRNEAPGRACANGGDRIDFGHDENENGTLDESEIDATAYACDGEDGSDAGVEMDSGTGLGALDIATDGVLGDPCYVDGTMAYGFCADTTNPNNCGGAGGTTHMGFCPNGDATILCCTDRPCGPPGRDSQGVCIPTEACNVSAGESLVMGLCPGSVNIQCCLP